MNAYNPTREEIFQIAGDAPDPMGTGKHGHEAAYSFTRSALAHPMIRYKDRVIEADLYLMGEELMLHLICPCCRNALRIESSRKRIEWDPDRGLSVEAFACTWELEEGRRTEFGVGLCPCKMVIENNIARDA